MPEPVVGVIGGSGLYQMEGLEDVEVINLQTAFGAPSSAITVGTLQGVGIAFVARHGHGHTLLPSEVPYRANIAALKTLGVKRVISISAVGSLREEFAPLDVVVPDQLFDRTKDRQSTFFGEGIVAHVSFAHPFCSAVSDLAFKCAQQSAPNAHKGGTLVTMEGPAFSTVAESEFYRRQGFSIIGMTALPEAKLAREAELCYCTIAMVTDYDVWHQTHEAVTQEMVAANVTRNTAVAHQILKTLCSRLGEVGDCDCGSALASALLTPFELVPGRTMDRLESIIGKYRRTDG